MENQFGDINQMMSAFTIIIGVFVLYSAITGKGPAYKSTYPKAMKAEADKLLRQLCWILAPILIVTGVLDYLGYTWAFWVNIGLMAPCLVVYFVLFRKKFKQYLQKK